MSLKKKLLLQILGVGRDNHPLVRRLGEEDRRRKVGDGFARTRARLGEEYLGIVERPDHAAGERDLPRSFLEILVHAGKRPSRLQHFFNPVLIHETAGFLGIRDIFGAEIAEHIVRPQDPRIGLMREPTEFGRPLDALHEMGFEYFARLDPVREDRAFISANRPSGSTRSMSSSFR